MNNLSGEDYFQIQNLVNSYLLYLDAGNAKEFAELFVEDAEIEVKLFNKIVKGREEIEQFCNDTHQKFLNATHWEANVVIGGIGSVARNDSYWQAISEGKIISIGKHEDTFTKRNNNWYFLKRIIYHTWRVSS